VTEFLAFWEYLNRALQVPLELGIIVALTIHLRRHRKEQQR
jgi:hypothetical protein